MFLTTYRNKPTRNFDELVEQFFNTNADVDTLWRPTTDVVENKDAYELHLELPGLEKKDVHINIENGELTITGERKDVKDEKGKNFHRIERRFGKFERSFTLPKNVQTDKVKANFKNGLLEIEVPKAEEMKPKAVQIEVK